MPAFWPFAATCGIIEIMKLQKLPQEFVRALPVLEKIEAAGFEAYFVGGSVRDVLLGEILAKE